MNRKGREPFGLNYNEDNFINAITMGSPAQISGKIRINDKIIAINDQRVDNGKETNERVLQSGTNIIIQLRRNGKFTLYISQI